MNNIRILYLYTNIMPYVVAVIKQLKENYGAEIIVYNTNSQTDDSPYILPKIDGVTFYSQNNYTKNDIINTIKTFMPNIIYVAGWIVPKYTNICKEIRKAYCNIPIIAGCDTQWNGLLKHRINSFLSAFRHKKYFSHIMVCGTSQYEYARRLGFDRNHILLNNYSADVSLFNKSEYMIEKKERLSHNFVFVGRLVKEKGIDCLVKAFNLFKKETNNDWKLICIGNGPLKHLVENNSNISYYPFLSQEMIIEKIKDYGCFVLASTFEPWGVVIHEFACTGLPLILSEKCGAAEEFLINKYNGFLFKSENIRDLANKMTMISQKEDKELLTMGKRSHSLGQRITPAITAASIISILS